MTPAAVHPFLLGLMKDGDAATLAPPGPEDEAWDEVIGDALLQGLAPLLHRWLTDSGWAAKLPPARLERIKADVFRLAARNLALAQEAATILRACEARQVACAPIRGLALAELLYGTIAARPMGDLDFLVRRDDLPAVADILQGLGFRERNRQPGFAQAYFNTLEFVSERHGGMVVEPHWTIAYPPFADRIDMEAVWRRCVRGTAVGADTWLLGREDLLLHLCFHLIHRSESAPLLWYYELDRLVRQAGDAFDWPRVVRMSRETGQALLTKEALQQVTGLFETPVPASVFSQLEASSAPHPRRSVGASVERRVVHMLAGNSRADGRESLALFFMIKGLRAKARYAMSLLFPSSEFMRLHYGPANRRQLGVCYLARMAHIAREGCKGVRSLMIPSGPTR